jgi:hypothetical protein
VTANGKPVAGARVRFKATAIDTLSDRDGRLLLPQGKGRVTAWKEGHFIAGVDARNAPLELRLVPLPRMDHEGYLWVDPAPDPKAPGNCGNCHVEIQREWAASGHGRSATGRHFRNLYEGTDWTGKETATWSLLKEHPDGSGVCASCHAPAIPEEDTKAHLDLRQLTGVASRGVHCDFCHKIADVGPGRFGLTHGRFNLRLLRPEREQLFFGPLDDVDRGEDTYSPLYRDSRYCASCHEGVVFGVPVYTTYSEWLASPARREGKHCQDCHMTPTGRMSNFATGKGGVEREPLTLANHRFFAPDRETMLREAIGLEATSHREAESVELTVRLWADDVGHRVPTGFIDRHLILVVEAFDTGGRALSVRTGPTLGAVAGEPLTGQAGRLFAKLATGRDGKSPAPFWLSAQTPIDTRLSPARVEETRWTFPATAEQLRVRLLYRRFWDATTRVKGWPERDLLVKERTLRLR